MNNNIQKISNRQNTITKCKTQKILPLDSLFVHSCFCQTAAMTFENTSHWTAVWEYECRGPHSPDLRGRLDNSDMSTVVWSIMVVWSSFCRSFCNLCVKTTCKRDGRRTIHIINARTGLHLIFWSTHHSKQDSMTATSSTLKFKIQI